MLMRGEKKRCAEGSREEQRKKEAGRGRKEEGQGKEDRVEEATVN